MTDPRYDIAIVGASLGGSAAAVVLGRAGYRVALFDKAEPLRDKPCGEGLSARGLAAAIRLGFWSAHRPPVPFRRYEGFQLRSGGVTRELSLPEGGVGIERRFFDAHVMTVAAATPGVRGIFGVRATPSVEGGDVRVRFGGAEISARYLIVADGANSKTARELGIETVRHGPIRAGAACHFEGRFMAEPRHVHIEVREGVELYATPLAGGRLNLAVLADAAARRNIRDVLLDPGERASIFAALRFEGEIAGEIVGRAPIGGGRRRGAPPGVLLVGDAAEEFDPIGGMGMSHALLSGELAAHAIIGGGALDREALTRRYEAAQRRLAAPFRRFTAMTHRTLRSAARWPMILRIATSRVGGYVVERVVP